MALCGHTDLGASPCRHGVGWALVRGQSRLNEALRVAGGQGGGGQGGAQIWAGQHLTTPPKEILSSQGSVGPSFLYLQGRAIITDTAG